jgi:predicted RNA-binding Zn-ribbon protein involved in translation (DUF1610 family)
VTAAAVTRFGDRIERGPAASFRCARCGEVAGVIRVVRAGTTVNMGPPLGIEAPARDGLVLDYFLGTAWHAQSAEILDAVQALIDHGHVDPLAIRATSWAFWEITPFYCPDCGLNYCSKDWATRVVFDEGFYDCTQAPARAATGTCSTTETPAPKPSSSQPTGTADHRPDLRSRWSRSPQPVAENIQTRFQDVIFEGSGVGEQDLHRQHLRRLLRQRADDRVRVAHRWHPSLDRPGPRPAGAVVDLSGGLI